MEKVMVSFCIPVYNQSQMVKECVSEILKYKGNDIEVVISDDCSAEDIEGLVRSFNDERVKYYCNEVNLGHDLNILSAFKRAKSDFAFLLRVRDRVLHTGIPLIIERIKAKPDLAYLTGNAVDENGNLRLAYHKESFSKGAEALERHINLYLHPSGSMYSLKLLDIDAAERFIRKNMGTKFGFLAHCMMRMELATKGDFEIICDTPIWQYTNTLNSKDVAVNSDKNKISVFAPVYVEQRFLREMEWADLCLPEEHKSFIFKWLIRYYLYLNTWGFKRRNEETALQKHYNCEKMPFSVSKEQKQFSKLCYDKIDELSVDNDIKNKLVAYYKKRLFINTTQAPVRFYLAKILRHTFIYDIHKKRNIQKGKT